MSKELKANLANLRQHIKGLREQFYRARFDRGGRGWRYDHARLESVRFSTARLKYLVPLYRALLATSQQRADGKGSRLYAKKFDELLKLMREAVSTTFGGWTLKSCFGAEVLELQLPVPTEDVSPGFWPSRSIGELLEDAKKQLAADRQAAVKRARTAEDARKFFLGSLNEGQRTLLKAALIAAKAKGTHAITIDERDLEGLAL